MKMRWPKGVLDLREKHLKLNLIKRYLAFEGHTSHIDAYVLRMRSVRLVFKILKLQSIYMVYIAE